VFVKEYERLRDRVEERGLERGGVGRRKRQGGVERIREREE